MRQCANAPMRQCANAPLMMLCAVRTALDGSSTTQLEGLPRRVLEQPNGNPLVIIELTAALGDNDFDAPIFAGDPLPTSRRVERAFMTQLGVLSDQSRLRLLLISISEGFVIEIGGAATHLGLNLAEHLGPDRTWRCRRSTARGRCQRGSSTPTWMPS
jgi:hypothetical protein